MSAPTPQELLALARVAGVDLLVHDGKLYVRGPEAAKALIERLKARVGEVVEAMLAEREDAGIVAEWTGPNGPHVVGKIPSDLEEERPGCLFCGEQAAYLGTFMPSQPWLYRRRPGPAGATVSVTYPLCQPCACERTPEEIEQRLERAAAPRE